MGFQSSCDCPVCTLGFADALVVHDMPVMFCARLLVPQQARRTVEAFRSYSRSEGRGEHCWCVEHIECNMRSYIGHLATHRIGVVAFCILHLEATADAGTDFLNNGKVFLSAASPPMIIACVDNLQGRLTMSIFRKRNPSCAIPAQCQ